MWLVLCFLPTIAINSTAIATSTIVTPPVVVAGSAAHTQSLCWRHRHLVCELGPTMASVWPLGRQSPLGCLGWQQDACAVMQRTLCAAALPGNVLSEAETATLATTAATLITTLATTITTATLPIASPPTAISLATSAGFSIPTAPSADITIATTAAAAVAAATGAASALRQCSGQMERPMGFPRACMRHVGSRFTVGRISRWPHDRTVMR